MYHFIWRSNTAKPLRFSRAPMKIFNNYCFKKSSSVLITLGDLGWLCLVDLCIKDKSGARFCCHHSPYMAVHSLNFVFLCHGILIQKMRILFAKHTQSKHKLTEILEPSVDNHRPDGWSQVIILEDRKFTHHNLSGREILRVQAIQQRCISAPYQACKGLCSGGLHSWVNQLLNTEEQVAGANM